MIFKDLERDIPSSSCDIQHTYRSLLLMRVNSTWSEDAQLLNEVILPVPMYSHRHEIIHDIVLVSDRVKHLIDKWLLLLGGHLDESEVVVLVCAEITKQRKMFE